MIDKALLARLTAPNYGPALHGFSKHLDPPPENKIVFYKKRWNYDGEPELRSSRPTIPWDAFDRFNEKGQRLCRVKTCHKLSLGGQWRHCSSKHSNLFRREVRYYDWDCTKADVAERDGGCVLCKMDSDKFYAIQKKDHEGEQYYYPKPFETHCDHIIPWSYVLIKFPDMPILEKIHRFYLNRENLRTLCPKCHNRVTTRFLAYLPKVKRWVELQQEEPAISPLTDFLGR